MSVNRRLANVHWNVTDEQGEIWQTMRAGKSLAVLMDIRDELQILNRLLGCQNFTGVPATLRKIVRNTTKRKRKP